MNDCIIQSEPSQYAEAEYLKASKLIYQCAAINRGEGAESLAGHIGHTSGEPYPECSKPI